MKWLTVGGLAVAGVVLGGAALGVGFWLGEAMQEKVGAPQVVSSEQQASELLIGQAPVIEEEGVVAGSISEARIVVVELPEKVASGEKFTVRWRVEGPTGAKGQQAKLEVLYSEVSEQEGSRASVNNNTSQSWGSFTVPEEFIMNLSLGSNLGGEARLAFMAEVEGKTLRVERVVELE
jgi:hypothetical protein